MDEISFIDKIGEGSYGKVYEYIQNGDRKILKYNLVDKIISGLGFSIKELDILSKLKGYPFIIDLMDISFNIPFNEKLLKKLTEEEERSYMSDNLFFIFEYAEFTLKSFLKKEKENNIKEEIICQILLATEYMHSKNITHRDLNPNNIMIKLSSSSLPSSSLSSSSLSSLRGIGGKEGEEGRGEINFLIKIIDFGMSQILSNNIPSTLGVSTCWYRAPEICCKINSYNYKCDLWSIGCIIYEIFSGEALLYRCEDSNTKIFNLILKKLPYLPNYDFINNMIKTNKKIKPNNSITINKKTFCTMMGISNTYKNKDNLEHLLKNLLEINYTIRYDATLALNHLFFNGNKDFIEDCRTSYLYNNKNTIPSITIIDCIEHKWMIDLSIIIFNKKPKEWYINDGTGDRILFHAMDLFDRYLEKEYYLNYDSTKIETDEEGKLHTSKDTIVIFNICLYLFYKYYSFMTFCCDFKTFSGLNINISSETIRTIEIKLLYEICNYELYRLTLLEIMNTYSKTKNTKQLLITYSSVISWKDGSVRALYRNLFPNDFENSVSTPI